MTEQCVTPPTNQGRPTEAEAKMQRRRTIGLLSVLLLGAIAGAVYLSVSAQRKARADAAACLRLNRNELDACRRAADRELKRGRVRAAVDYLALGCERDNATAATACALLDELQPKVMDRHCNIINDGPDAENLTLRTSTVRTGNPTVCKVYVDEIVPVGEEIPAPHGLHDGATWKHANMVFDVVHLFTEFEDAECHPIWFDGARALEVTTKWAGNASLVSWLHFDGEIQLDQDGFPVDERVLSHVDQHACEMGADGIGEAARAQGDKGPVFFLFRVPVSYREWKKHHQPGSGRSDSLPKGSSI